MSNREIHGNLADDAKTERRGGHVITTMTVMETTGTWIKGEWVDDDEPTAHAVKCWRTLGEATAGLPKGTPVIVHGRERTEAWTTPDGDKGRRRVIEADHVGPDMRYVDVQIRPRATRAAATRTMVQEAQASWQTFGKTLPNTKEHLNAWQRAALVTALAYARTPELVGQLGSLDVPGHPAPTSVREIGEQFDELVTLLASSTATVVEVPTTDTRWATGTAHDVAAPDPASTSIAERHDHELGE